jgi:DNA polymerase-3 subunit alpha
MNALYRPGPLDAGTIDDYIRRKHGKEEVTYAHPKLEPILRETYGVIVYQEQVIRIAVELAGYTAGEGDILRKAMGKKVKEIMEQQRKSFKEGCRKNGIEDDVADTVFEQIETFARYGFNKSHAAGYSYLAYQTAYLKAHYPREFMAASLTSEMGNTDRVIVLMEECRRLGIPVLPPDVNFSRAEFTVENEEVRFGLGAVKNVGLAAIEAMQTAREEGRSFKSIFDFVARVDLRSMNRRMLESLIKAGATDSLPGHRAQHFEAIDSALSFGQARQATGKNGNQESLFGDQAEDVGVVEPELPPVKEWDKATTLRYEKQLLGFFISGHPLESYRTLLSTVATCTSESVAELPDGSGAVIGGIFTKARVNIDKKGKRMAFATLEDFAGSIEMIIFSDLFEKRREVVEAGSMVVVSGRISKREDEKPKIVAGKIDFIDDIAEGAELTLRLLLNGPTFNGDRFEHLEAILSEFPGSADVVLVLNTGEEQVVVKTGSLKASAKPGLTRRLSELLGSDCVRWEVKTAGNSHGTDVW